MKVSLYNTVPCTVNGYSRNVLNNVLIISLRMSYNLFWLHSHQLTSFHSQPYCFLSQVTHLKVLLLIFSIKAHWYCPAPAGSGGFPQVWSVYEGSYQYRNPPLSCPAALECQRLLGRGGILCSQFPLHAGFLSGLIVRSSYRCCQNFWDHMCIHSVCHPPPQPSLFLEDLWTLVGGCGEDTLTCTLLQCTHWLISIFVLIAIWYKRRLLWWRLRNALNIAISHFNAISIWQNNNIGLSPGAYDLPIHKLFALRQPARVPAHGVGLRSSHKVPATPGTALPLLYQWVPLVLAAIAVAGRFRAGWDWSSFPSSRSVHYEHWPQGMQLPGESVFCDSTMWYLLYTMKKN